MFIKRTDDKTFTVTLTEPEAQTISDTTEIDFHHSRLLANRIGSTLLNYMTEASKFPHARRRSIDVELFPDGS